MTQTVTPPACLMWQEIEGTEEAERLLAPDSFLQIFSNLYETFDLVCPHPAP